MAGTITIKYGLGNSITRTVDTPITVGSLLTPNVRNTLGLPSNISVFRNGVEITQDTYVQDGETLEIQAKACAKA